MSKLIDLSGQRFGFLTVIQRAPKISGEKPKWICQCDCGKQIAVDGARLRSGHTKSCGCFSGKPLVMRRSHGNRLYNIWAGMKYRCLTPTCPEYSHYGGRGISICSEWLNENGYENFAEWALTHGYEKSLEIDRIDNDGNYSPENCRWVPHNVNSQNRGRPSLQKGITLRKTKHGVVYRASISVHNRHIHLGTYNTYEEAVEARKQAEIKYWGWQKSK